MSPYRLLILLGAIADFIRIFVFLFNTRKSVQVYPFAITKFISVFCEDFLYSLFKMEKKELQRLYSKKIVSENMNILKIFCY